MCERGDVVKSNKKLFFIIFFSLNILSASCGTKTSELPGKNISSELPGKNISLELPEKNISNGIYLEGENVGGKKISEVKHKLEELSSRINIGAKDAVFDKVRWEISSKEKKGKSVNIEKTMESLMNAKEGEKISLVVEEITPGVTSEKAAGKIVEIASYSTRLLDKQNSRVNNIAIAARKLNYKIIAQGEEFSFNAALGRRTQAKGYEEAPIIIKTEDGYEKGFGVGGGICQLSTTLYNAVEKCGMDITERHLHSKSIGYVPKGKDATVAYGAADFKFVNNRGYPVMIRTGLDKNTLTVRIIENRSGL